MWLLVPGGLFLVFQKDDLLEFLYTTMFTGFTDNGLKDTLSTMRNSWVKMPSLGQRSENGLR